MYSQLLKRLVPVLIASLLFMGCTDYELDSSKETSDCPIKPFDKFAYTPDEESLPIQKILPSEPWRLESIIPERENKSNTVVELTRTKDGVKEVWVFQAPSYRGRTLLEEASFLIYYPASNVWKEVPAQIEDTNLIVTDIFVISDGNIWGGLGNYQDRLNPPYPNQVSVLSKFNESTQIFEEVVGGLDIPIVEEQIGLIGAPKIVLDRQDNFWIFARQDGIYRYDTKTQTTNRQANLPHPNMDVIITTLSSDGSIYFQDIYPPHDTENFLYQFLPETGEVATIEVDYQPWKYSNGMLVDHQERLWLGATGYRDAEEKWHLIHPHPEKAYKHLGEPLWGPPTLIFESSDGILWYTENNDMERLGEGTAWYNPDTGEGCLFTNIASYIVEDADKQLWMVADGNLYRYPLEE